MDESITAGVGDEVIVVVEAIILGMTRWRLEKYLSDVLRMRPILCHLGSCSTLCADTWSTLKI